VGAFNHYGAVRQPCPSDFVHACPTQTFPADHPGGLWGLLRDSEVAGDEGTDAAHVFVMRCNDPTEKRSRQQR
jgi:hypothetical protein